MRYSRNITKMFINLNPKIPNFARLMFAATATYAIGTVL